MFYGGSISPATATSFLALSTLSTLKTIQKPCVWEEPKVELKEKRSTFYEARTKITDIGVSIKAMACPLLGFWDRWMPMLAWKSAIKQEISNDYDVAHVSKAINQLQNKFGSTFSATTRDGEFHIFHHMKKVQTKQGKKQDLPFFWVQAVNYDLKPLIPTNTDYWQKLFKIRYATQFQPKRELWSQKRESLEAMIKRSKRGFDQKAKEVINNLRNIGKHQIHANVSQSKTGKADTRKEEAPTSFEVANIMTQMAWKAIYHKFLYPETYLYHPGLLRSMTMG
jgi:hypothetical protein